MRGKSKALLSLPFSFLFPIKRCSFAKPPIPTSSLLGFCPLSTTTNSPDNDKASKSEPEKRDSVLLEKFRQRKLKGSSTITHQSEAPVSPALTPGSSSAAEKEGENGLQNDGGDTMVVSSFKELNLSEELIEAADEMGVFVPSEIQCVGIPAVLEGKNVVLSAPPKSGRTLAYLLPLVQLLRRDTEPKHPRAVVLCPTEELSDEVFHMAKFISDKAQQKSVKESGSPQESLPNVPIGMTVGTPSEVLQQIEEGIVVLDEIKYLVLDEVDAMFGCGLGPEIQKLISPVKNRASKSNQGLQTVLVTSSIAKILGEELSPLEERLKHDHAGQIAAVILELDQTEVFHLTESLDTLKKKVAEAMDSLTINTSES